MTMHKALPPQLPPRIIDRHAAAAYVGVSPNTYDIMENDGRMPRPRILQGRRRGYLVPELDRAADALAVAGGEEEKPDETWDD